MNNPNDATAKHYDAAFSPLKGRDITDAEIALISSIVPTNSNILDIGAGTGRHLIPLSELGYNMTGIDSSNGMLDVLEEKLQDKSKSQIIRGDVLTYDFNSTNFDLIILMWNSFNEIALNEKSAQRLLSIFGKVLKIGGKVLINSDNPEKTTMESADYHLISSQNNLDYDVSWKLKDFNNKDSTSVYDEKISVDGKTYITEIKQKWWTESEYKYLGERNGFKFEKLDFKKNNELYISLTKEGN
ncbi:MAG: class I SAM-dependent methyltransferase [Candidatus Dojkabacteria bacterium]